MTKKILSALVLISFLVALVVPMIASAQEAPKNCCVLKRTIELEGKSCAAGTVAGPSADVIASGGACYGMGSFCDNSKDRWGMFCLMNTLYSVTDWIFVILVALAGLFVILGAMNLIMAAGDPEKVTKGRNYIMYAAIGLIVGFIARAIPSIVRMIVGA